MREGNGHGACCAALATDRQIRHAMPKGLTRRRLGEARRPAASAFVRGSRRGGRARTTVEGAEPGAARAGRGRDARAVTSSQRRQRSRRRRAPVAIRVSVMPMFSLRRGRPTVFPQGTRRAGGAGAAMP
jgi:hypothetical protein